MDLPKHPVGTEEDSSNESGWTMYIGSPYRDYEDDDEGTPRNDYNEDGGSDDSMTSDASSAPSHQGTSIEQSYGKRAEKETRKEQQRQVKKKHSDKITKVAKEDSSHKAKSGKDYGYCRSKIRGKH